MWDDDEVVYSVDEEDYWDGEDLEPLYPTTEDGEFDWDTYEHGSCYWTEDENESIYVIGDYC